MSIEVLRNLLLDIRERALLSTKGDVRLPEQLEEILSSFGHGTWGREMVFLHPSARNSQQLSLNKPKMIRDFFGSAVGDKMKGPHPSEWNFLPIGIFPSRSFLLWNRLEPEVVIYDGDFDKLEHTGAKSVAAFLISSKIGDATGELWAEIVETNFTGSPLFTTAFPDSTWASVK